MHLFTFTYGFRIFSDRDTYVRLRHFMLFFSNSKAKFSEVYQSLNSKLHLSYCYCTPGCDLFSQILMMTFVAL